jgi:hypothetical protein
LRMPFGRRIVGPVRDTDASDDASPRALVHGPSTQPGDDRLVVMGPSRDAMSLVRQLSFVPAFDPLGIVRRAPLAMRDLVTAAHASGIPVADVLRDDPVPSAVVPVTPSDAGAPDDLLVQIAGGALAVARASSATPVRARFAVEPGRGDEWRIVSAHALDLDSMAWLEEDASGHARVMRVGPSGVASPVFELDAPPTGDLYPPNVDALASGPHGELGILRTPSGSEPASDLDPAVVVLANGSALALASWSTLVSADDSACKGDPSGWRATIQTMAPWLRLTGPADLHAQDESTMIARVRWGSARVCLEAVETRSVDMTIPSGSSPTYGSPWDQPAESWVVARFAGGATAGRVVVLPGAELHQAIECSLGP